MFFHGSRQCIQSHSNTRVINGKNRGRFELWYIYNQDNIPLVYNTLDNPDRMVNFSEPLKDSVSKWANTLRIVSYRTFVIKGIEIVEFSAPVISDVFSQ